MFKKKILIVTSRCQFPRNYHCPLESRLTGQIFRVDRSSSSSFVLIRTSWLNIKPLFSVIVPCPPWSTSVPQSLDLVYVVFGLYAGFGHRLPFAIHWMISFSIPTDFIARPTNFSVFRYIRSCNLRSLWLIYFKIDTYAIRNILR